MHKMMSKNLTTNQGVKISDNQNSLKIGENGPTLLEDFILREKIFHFDHERIPERIVHARGAGAYGIFYPVKNLNNITKAKFLSEETTPVFVRFSTVAGGAGSNDVVRDVRGFAVKFYTSEGNFDLVGNNIPVFFIQDAIKFPDLIHSVKMEPDRGFPQAASAHPTFWDFVSLMPESINMIMWIMSDRAIPRSYRMMEGFGVHTFKMINCEGKLTYVKFHWRPRIGSTSNLWNENVKLGGIDCDFFRKDLYNAIEREDYPVWDFYIQKFDQTFVDKFIFSVFDATKIIPEEIIPLEHIGTMILNKNPNNFFSEVEQAAFCPGNIIPGIDFSDDPLLQGRLFSYLDTQLSRLGTTNFHNLSVNRPMCPYRNFQRDGRFQTINYSGRVSYEPNSLDKSSPVENINKGFVTYPEKVDGNKTRTRSELFSDHYSQAKQFWISMTNIEQDHIINAFITELSNVNFSHIRLRILSMLKNVSKKLCNAVASGLGITNDVKPIKMINDIIKLPPSDSLSLIKKFKPSVSGRNIGIIINNGINMQFLSSMITEIKNNSAHVTIIAPTIDGIKSSNGEKINIDVTLANSGSEYFDACIFYFSNDPINTTIKSIIMDWSYNAYTHLKVIGYSNNLREILSSIININQPGIVKISNISNIEIFLYYAKYNRIWERAGYDTKIAPYNLANIEDEYKRINLCKSDNII